MYTCTDGVQCWHLLIRMAEEDLSVVNEIKERDLWTTLLEDSFLFNLPAKEEYVGFTLS